MQRRLCSGVVVFLSILALTLSPGCRNQNRSSAVTVSAKFEPQPARIGKEAIFIEVADSAGRPLSGAHVTVEGNMSHPGMAPVLAEAKETGPGKFQASLDLGMRGSWAVLLHVRLPDGKTVERQIALDVKGE